jgi:hypothetical protein
VKIRAVDDARGVSKSENGVSLDPGTVTLCVVTVVLAAAAVLGWWGAEPMRARAPATLLLLTGIGLTAYTALQCVPIRSGGWR